MVEINNKLYEKATEQGISKAEYHRRYKFDVFKITDMKRHSRYNEDRPQKLSKLASVGGNPMSKS